MEHIFFFSYRPRSRLIDLDPVDPDAAVSSVSVEVNVTI
jgi:hypothetical protein